MKKMIVRIGVSVRRITILYTVQYHLVLLFGGVAKPTRGRWVVEPMEKCNMKDDLER